MKRRLLLSATLLVISATPLTAGQPLSTITYRSPTFTGSSAYYPSSTLVDRSPTFTRPGLGYGYFYDPWTYSPGHLSRISGPYSSYSGSSFYYRSTLSSGRGLDASRHFYGSSGYRTYCSP